MYEKNYFYQSTPQTNLQPNDAQQGSYYNGQLVANQQCQNL